MQVRPDRELPPNTPSDPSSDNSPLSPQRRRKVVARVKPMQLPSPADASKARNKSTSPFHGMTKLQSRQFRIPKDQLALREQNCDGTSASARKAQIPTKVLQSLEHLRTEETRKSSPPVLRPSPRKEGSPSDSEGSKYPIDHTDDLGESSSEQEPASNGGGSQIGSSPPVVILSNPSDEAPRLNGSPHKTDTSNKDVTSTLRGLVASESEATPAEQSQHSKDATSSKPKSKHTTPSNSSSKYSLARSEKASSSSNSSRRKEAISSGVEASAHPVIAKSPMTLQQAHAPSDLALQRDSGEVDPASSQLQSELVAATSAKNTPTMESEVHSISPSPKRQRQAEKSDPDQPVRSKRRRTEPVHVSSRSHEDMYYEPEPNRRASAMPAPATIPPYSRRSTLTGRGSLRPSPVETPRKVGPGRILYATFCSAYPDFQGGYDDFSTACNELIRYSGREPRVYRPAIWDDYIYRYLMDDWSFECEFFEDYYLKVPAVAHNKGIVTVHNITHPSQEDLQTYQWTMEAQERRTSSSRPSLTSAEINRLSNGHGSGRKVQKLPYQQEDNAMDAVSSLESPPPSRKSYRSPSRTRREELGIISQELPYSRHDPVRSSSGENRISKKALDKQAQNLDNPYDMGAD